MEMPTLMNYANTSNTYQMTPYYGASGTACDDLTKAKDWAMQLGLQQQDFKPQPKKEIVKMADKPTCRIVRVFIVDSDENLTLEQRVIHSTEEKLTDQTDQELFMEIGVAPILKAHNELRAKTLDKKATNKAGKDVFLEPIRIRDLKMVVSSVAEF